MITNLEQSQWLEGVAKGIPVYADEGLSGWLKAKKDSEWPSLVWAGGGKAQFSFRLAWWRTEYDMQPHLEYYHALDLLDVFALLGEVGWFWHKLDGAMPWKAYRPWPGAVVEASSPGELLDKIRETVKEKP